MGIVSRIKNIHNNIWQQIRLIYIRQNKNISILNHNNIFPNVHLETNYGGSINIGTKNEFLYGVCLMTYGGKITIGNNCSINPYTIIYGHGEGVQIGNNVLIAGHCMIIPSNHNFSKSNVLINQQGATSKGIKIEDDVWLGTGVKVLDGVTIAKGCVIAAGAIVNQSTEAYSVYAGVPAKKIKNRLDV